MLTAIIVAAGGSQRMGFDKTFALLNGMPAIAHSLCAFEQCNVVDDVIVVGRADRLREIEEIATQLSIKKISRITAGGNERQDSVRAGLAHLSASAQFVAVHDAARPLITPEQIAHIFSLAQIHLAAAAAKPVTDTLKRADENCFVSDSVERLGVYAMATPQIFSRKLIIDAYDAVVAKGISVTDDVSAVQLLGQKVVLVPTSGWNFKITYPGDLALAELLLAQRDQS
ncbi:MAG: 2-C-methyl-D-erythritol 4-phosphate cytidylyltransferase [Chthoniobacterales bacterium]